ncbi:MAG: zinc-ribbon domain-containing protein [Candidatus Binataceae bacterium]|nr:zinc-ribbon domain-containing protein [Candidatus Binataceae bacterium]
MIEIQCTSCHTRYRIDERVLPEDTPTFKCSRCGHVFAAEPRAGKRADSVRRSVEPAHDFPETQLASTPGQHLSEEQVAKPDGRPAAEILAVPESSPDLNVLERGAASADGQAPSAGEILNHIDPPPILRAVPRRSNITRPGPEISTKAVAPPDSEPLSNTVEPIPPAKPVRFVPPPSESVATDHANGLSGSASGAITGGNANLSFDFTDEPSSSDGRRARGESNRDRDGDWRVGHDHEFEGNPLLGRDLPPAPAPEVDEDPEDESDSPFFNERSTMSRRAAYGADRITVHSVGLVLGFFLLVVIAFGFASLLICNAPTASAGFLNNLPGIAGRFAPPIVPARLVALKDVTTSSRILRGNVNALVITGKAENVGGAPLHTVQIAADLLDRNHRPLAMGTAFCGNNLAPAMLNEMTPREIDFLQKLEPQKHFILKPMEPVPFTMVFINPPGSADNLSLAVTRAIPAPTGELSGTAAN